ncbi:MAG TPA: amidohydrolase family protein [Caldilineaceae bacterium]|nr:amidohydrolase family protein [Caldilineaceae bacterium]
MIIEWNIHIFHADTTRYPFHPKAVYTPDPAKFSRAPLDDYLAHMTAEGIDRAILVHPEPYGDDHRLVLDCLEREPDRFLGTSLFYPRDPAAPDKLTALVQRQPKIIATRFHAHRGKTAYFERFDELGVVALWQRAAELGLVVELHIGPNFATQAAALITRFPATPVLIDHLAEPHMGNAVEFAEILALSRFDNVYMKLSGLNHFADDAPLYRSAKNFTRLVADAFGSERMVWGSGTPTIVDAHLAHLSEAERAKVKGGNLAALLPW